MDLRGDDAVSPVIGVLLMVAITVVLAATVWVLISEVDHDASNPEFPAVKMTVGTPTDGLDDDWLVLEHRGGRCIDLDDFTFRVQGAAGGQVVLVEDDADGGWCVGEDLVLDEGAADDLAAADADAALTLQVIFDPSSTIVFEKLLAT